MSDEYCKLETEQERRKDMDVSTTSTGSRRNDDRDVREKRRQRGGEEEYDVCDDTSRNSRTRLSLQASSASSSSVSSDCDSNGSTGKRRMIRNKKERKHKSSRKDSKRYSNEKRKKKSSKRQHKSSSKRIKKDDTSNSENDDDDNGNSDVDKRVRAKRNKSKYRKRKRYDDYDSNSDSDSDSSSQNNNKKKKKKLKKRKEKKRKHNSSVSSSPRTKTGSIQKINLERNYQLADALYELLTNHPIFVDDLPILLVRLATGSTFDLRSMPSNPAQALATVLQCLQPFGVSYNTNNDSLWRWTNPIHSVNTSASVSKKSVHVQHRQHQHQHQHTQRQGNNSNTNTNELVLIKVIRSLLNEIGFTIDAVQQPPPPQQQQQHNHLVDTTSSTKTAKTISVTSSINKTVHEHDEQQDSKKSYPYSEIIQVTSSLLLIVPQSTQSIPSPDDNNGQQNNNNQQQQQWATELASLLQMIVDGECISIDNLPNVQIRDKLETLFTICHLEKSEMEDDDDDDNDDHDEVDHAKADPTYGYCLPEQNDSTSKQLLSYAIDTCLGKIMLQQYEGNTIGTSVPATTRKRVIGPSFGPTTYDDNKTKHDLSYSNNNHDDDDDDNDDEGPQQYGISCGRTPLSTVKPITTSAPGLTREEWMIVPGKFDFLASIQSGGINSMMRSRTFQGKQRNSDGGGGGGGANEASGGPKIIDPSILNEIQALQQQVDAARGPSLFELHRQKQQEHELNNLKGSKKKESWKWNRDSDLDSGRRVDKEALQMTLGGAGKDLKTKFHKG